MSCWVVPSVAAEFLGISIAAVLEQARSGLIPTKSELGFTLLDVAPNSPRVETGFRAPTTAPRTYRTTVSDELSAAEQEALGADDAIDPTLEPEEVAALAEGTLEPDQTFDWRKARQHAGRQRRAPRAMHAAA
jgi:hypothetical protein